MALITLGSRHGAPQRRRSRDLWHLFGPYPGANLVRTADARRCVVLVADLYELTMAATYHRCGLHGLVSRP